MARGVAGRGGNRKPKDNRGVEPLISTPPHTHTLAFFTYSILCLRTKGTGDQVCDEQDQPGEGVT